MAVCGREPGHANGNGASALSATSHAFHVFSLLHSLLGWKKIFFSTKGCLDIYIILMPRTITNFNVSLLIDRTLIPTCGCFAQPDQMISQAL